MTTTIYVPTSTAAPDVTGRAPSPAALTGLRIAVLDNGKANADVVMARAASSLASATGATVSLLTKKGPGGRSANAAIPCAADIMDRLVDEADLVITGAADCGSCTAYSVYDAIELERLGRPTAIVTTTKFRPVAETMSANFGLPDARLLVLPHPLGGTDAATLHSWADAAVDALTSLYTGTEHVAVVEAAGTTASHGSARIAASTDDPLEAGVRSAAVGSALADVCDIVAADGGELRLLEHDRATGVVTLDLILTDASCAECVMPADYLEQLALAALKPIASVRRVTVNDPRR